MKSLYQIVLFTVLFAGVVATSEINQENLLNSTESILACGRCR